MRTICTNTTVTASGGRPARYYSGPGMARAKKEMPHRSGMPKSKENGSVSNILGIRKPGLGHERENVALISWAVI